jgi:hypothetical protein
MKTFDECVEVINKQKVVTKTFKSKEQDHKLIFEWVKTNRISFKTFSNLIWYVDFHR